MRALLFDMTGVLLPMSPRIHLGRPFKTKMGDTAKAVASDQFDSSAVAVFNSIARDYDALIMSERIARSLMDRYLRNLLTWAGIERSDEIGCMLPMGRVAGTQEGRWITERGFEINEVVMIRKREISQMSLFHERWVRPRGEVLTRFDEKVEKLLWLSQ